MRLGKTTFTHFISQVVVSVAGFVATFAIARILGAEGVGIYALGVALLMWLKIPTNGITSGITKRISEGTDRSEFLTSGAIIMTLVGVCLALLLVVFRAYVNSYVGTSVAVLLAAVLLADMAFRTVGGVLKGEKKVARYGWATAFERILRTGFQVVLILLGYGIAGLFLGHAAALALAAVLGGLVLGVRPAVPGRRHFRSLIDFAQYSWLGGLKGRTFGWMDTIVLGFFVTSSHIGIYEVAWTLASFLVIVANSIQTTLFPELSELSADNRADRIHHYIDEGLVFTGIFLIPGFFGALALGTDVLRIYSPEFTQGTFVLLLLIAARTFDAYGAQFVSAINALDRPEVAFRINGLFVAINMTLNVALVAMFGWYGAAVATLLSGVVTLLLSFRAISRLIGTPSVPYGEILRQIVAGVVMLGVVFAADQFIPQSHYMTVFMVAIGGTVYVLSLLGLSTRVRQKTSALTESI